MAQKAYMVGSGIGNLTAAFYLIRDGKWNGDQITIIGLDKHGANDGNNVSNFEHEYGSGYQKLGNNKGFLNRGGRMLNEETYENLWDVLKDIPSLDHPGQSVFDEIVEFDHTHPTYSTSRLIDTVNGLRNKGDKDDYSHMQFDNKDRLLLTKLMMMPERDEHKLNDVSIEDWFKSSPHFFTTNFWHMWQTTFAFLEVSSAMELRRYMNRMILEFSRINTLEGVTRTPYNQYESLILPIRAFLEKNGVHFIDYMKVTEFKFKHTDHEEIIVNGLVYENIKTNEVSEINVADDDLVFCTNGSITDSASIGDFDTPVTENNEYAPSAALWKQATQHFSGLGNPDKFFNDRTQSEWLSWTITSGSRLLLTEIENITHQTPGNALQTWVDSNAVFSIVVHWQPHYHTQKENETVIWGYVLYPRRNGDYIEKPYIEMTGKELLIEVIDHLSAIDKREGEDNIASKKDQIIAETINSIPVYMPYASALFNQRAVGDRPPVIPQHSKNLAFISQFVEMPFDMVFTEQYSVRAAQIATYGLLHLDKELTPLHHYEKDPSVMLNAGKTMFR